MRWFVRILQIGVLAALLIGGWLFASENGAPVQVSYVLGQTGEIRLWQALLSAFALGALGVGAFTLLASVRHGMVQRRYRKLVGGLESELHQLRNLPLSPDPDAKGGARPAQSGGVGGRGA
jgi:uncharacterized integral membrane protein